MASLRSISSQDRTDMSSISVPTAEDKPVVDETAEQAEVSGEASDAFKSQFRVEAQTDQLARVLKSEGYTVQEAGYFSLSEVAAQQGGVAKAVTSPNNPETEDDELAEELLIEVESSVPAAINAPPVRIPVIKIHFMRHAQAEHNVKNLLEGFSIQNPSLTDVGHGQCEVVCKTFPHMDKITHILCSPLMRTVQTAVESFKPLFDRGLKVVLWSRLIEFGQGPTNRGDPVPELKKKLEGQPVELDYLSDDWEKGSNGYLERNERVKKVARTLHTFCRVATRSGDDPEERLDVELLVISHGAFLRHLIRERPRFSNSQVRTCEFASVEQQQKGARSYDLFETAESKMSVYRCDWNNLEVSMDRLDLAGED